jgi:hypothetical protein
VRRPFPVPIKLTHEERIIAMSDELHIDILKKGADAWNRWRQAHSEQTPTFSNRHGYRISAPGGANLEGAKFDGVDMTEWDLSGANLTNASLTGAKLLRTNLSGAVLVGASLNGVNMSSTNFFGANLRGAQLVNTQMLRTDFRNADLRDCTVQYASVWDIRTDYAKQDPIYIANTQNSDDPIDWTPFPIDDLEFAQLIYTILRDHKKMAGLMKALAKRVVLLLGHICPEDKKEVLEAMADKLRHLPDPRIPMTFDFLQPKSLNYKETVLSLASLSEFVVADVSEPRSTPMELATILSNLAIPVVCVIQGEGMPFSMISDFQSEIGFVGVVHFKEVGDLIEDFEALVIGPAQDRFNHIQEIKQRVPMDRYTRAFMRSQAQDHGAGSTSPVDRAQHGVAGAPPAASG